MQHACAHSVPAVCSGSGLLIRPLPYLHERIGGQLARTRITRSRQARCGVFGLRYCPPVHPDTLECGAAEIAVRAWSTHHLDGQEQCLRSAGALASAEPDCASVQRCLHILQVATEAKGFGDEECVQPSRLWDQEIVATPICVDEAAPNAASVAAHAGSRPASSTEHAQNCHGVKDLGIHRFSGAHKRCKG